MIAMLAFYQMYLKFLKTSFIKQISEFFNKIFSKHQTGFRKGFNAQTCLVTMVEEFRKCLDDGGEYAALFYTA